MAGRWTAEEAETQRCELGSRAMSGSQLWAAVLLLLVLQSAQGVYIKVRPWPAYLVPGGYLEDLGSAPQPV